MPATQQRFENLIRQLLNWPRLADFLALLGGVWGFIQLWVFAHNRDSVLDEGAYLYKGFLYASGQFKMYQPNGPWSYHLPLAYLIPGYIQKFFGPGLAAGRIFSILVAMLTFSGLWLLIRRLKGPWWAAGILWLYILNPATLKTFSLGITQVQIACMLVWMLYCLIGDDRPTWQIIVGSLLAGIMFITRLNIIPVLPLAVLYIYWQHGLKKAVLALIVGVLPIIVVHFIYWPDILQVWGWWLPRSFTPFLDAWRIPSDYQRYWSPQISIQNQVASFFMAFRFHFTTLVAALAAFLLWPRRSQWQDQDEYRSTVFTSSLLVVLYLFHLWAALGKNYCVQCLTAYTAFYSMLGLVILAQSFSTWRTQLPAWRVILIVIIILVISAGIGYSALEDIGGRILDLRLPIVLSDPRSLDFSTERLRKTLTTRLDLTNLQQRMWVSTTAGLMAGMVVILAAVIWYGIHNHSRRVRGSENGKTRLSIGYYALLSFLIAGILLTPTYTLGGGPYAYDCSGDTIQSYQQAGEHLAKLIPPGSTIFWAGELSAVPLLYVPDSHTFSPLIEGSYSRYVGGNPEILLRFGLWNDQIAQQWAGESDFLLVKERYYEGWLKDLIESGKFDELEPSPPVVDCRNDSRIHIFERIKTEP
jgi:hypothetical protein